MGNVQYRATVWICRRLSNELCSEDICQPIRLFQSMMNESHISWGHYAVYMTWLHRHFGFTHGCHVFHYLKKRHASHMYSFWYLAGVYYGYKIVCCLGRSLPIGIKGGCCQIGQSPPDSTVSSQEGTTTMKCMDMC